MENNFFPSSSRISSDYFLDQFLAGTGDVQWCLLAANRLWRDSCMTQFILFIPGHWQADEFQL